MVQEWGRLFYVPRRNERSKHASRVGIETVSGTVVPNPAQDGVGVRIWWKDGVENVLDNAVSDDECQSPNTGHVPPLECR